MSRPRAIPPPITEAQYPRLLPSYAPRRVVSFWLLILIVAILVFGALKMLATVAIPTVLAMFVALAIVPLDRSLREALPNKLTWLGRVGVMLVPVAVLTVFLGGLAFCITEIATNLPDVPQQIDRILPTTASEGPFASIFNALRDTVSGQVSTLTTRLIETATGLAQGIASTTGAALAGLVLVLFLILLALSEAEVWAVKFDVLSTGSGGTWRQVTHTLGKALRRFIATRALVGVISSVAYTLWLLPFGLDLLLVWAILVFLMGFIPNIGALISGVFPTIYAFMTLDPGTAFLIGIGLIMIEQGIGNWVDPRLQGKRIALSPLMILIAVVFWGWLWGIAGAFLGTPMTLGIMILCNAVEPLRPVALLLSNCPTHEDLDAALRA